MSLTVVLIIVAMLLLNGVFAAYELALASVRLDRLKVLADQKRRGAADRPADEEPHGRFAGSRATRHHGGRGDCRGHGRRERR